MSASLDLHDIQGNIIKAYGHFGFPVVRYIFYKINNETQGRQFISQLVDYITTAAKWDVTGTVNGDIPKPLVTTNIAFTYSGLKKLGVPRQSLQSFPDEFAMGMKARHAILGDDLKSSPDNWDPIWQSEDQVDIWLSINGQSVDAINTRYQELLALLENTNQGVEQLHGHRGDNAAEDLPYQEASAIFKNGIPTPKEHFGYTDGISDPFFKGTGSNPANVIGGGKPTGDDPATISGWEPLETGEFILGHRDEAFEYPMAPYPRLLSYNGTFMVFRKLHENVASFNNYLKTTAEGYPDSEESLAAKFVGRWRNGAPITKFPSENDATKFNDRFTAVKQQIRNAGSTEERESAQQEYLQLRSELVGFNFNNDIEGARCPLSAHTRRANPRGSLEFGVKDAFNTPGALINRRRILRRGLPYGDVTDPTQNNGNHGIIFMAINANIKRQFEFVQQQWINYGNDFKQSSDKDPILGNHGVDDKNKASGRMVIEADPNGEKAPFFCSNIPRFVETRGGDYFFIPSLTALRMIGEGIIDPT
ncbi:Dye-decolorizing peroxidase [hydrothermal vent metagenome]|uniref:Dye-decolorizing peroxidase n=1 Tax=hydrothermal vent metagenome TaxID=652676 RepID=A0A3B1AEN2_9ZZZZ